jgi:RNA polymerase sigma factor (sigma-70 family)
MLTIEKSRNLNRLGGHDIQTRVKQAARIFQEYQTEIYTIILFHIDDSFEADDIFQDLFLNFVRNPVPSDTKNVKAYIYKTITNDIFDLVRKEKNYQYRITRYAERRKCLCSSCNPEDKAIQSEEFQKLFDLIETQLPPRQAQAIHLRFINNCTTSEAAQEMGE